MERRRSRSIYAEAGRPRIFRHRSFGLGHGAPRNLEGAENSRLRGRPNRPSGDDAGGQFLRLLFPKRHFNSISRAGPKVAVCAEPQLSVAVVEDLAPNSIFAPNGVLAPNGIFSPNGIFAPNGVVAPDDRVRLRLRAPDQDVGGYKSHRFVLRVVLGYRRQSLEVHRVRVPERALFF